MDTKEFKDFYAKLNSMDKISESKTDEEIVKELGLGDYKELDYKESDEVNRKFLKENDLDNDLCFYVTALIGDKGFVVNHFYSTLKLNLLQKQFLNKLAYKSECFSIVEECFSIIEKGKYMIFDDLDCQLILLNTMKELENENYIDNMNVRNEDIIYKQYEYAYIFEYIYFSMENMKLPQKLSKEDLKSKETIKSLPRYNKSSFDATNFGKARIIDSNLINLDKLGEVYLTNRLPNTNLEFILYPNRFQISTDLENPKNIVYSMNASLIFLEGQDKLFK